MGSKKKDDEFSPAETKRRFDAALRGARIAGHKQMKDLPKKGDKPKSKAKRLTESR